MAIVPSKFFFTKGTGIHEKQMRAFEGALRDAGVHTCNFVRISSVIPPGCKMISKEEGVKLLKPGQITFAIMAESMTNEPGQTITAGIGMALPKDRTQHGFLTEAEGIMGRTAEDVEQDVIEMSIENVISQYDPKFDAETVIRRGKKNYSIKGHELVVDSVVQTAQGAEKNQFTVVVALAVFIYDN
jgi:arginine decarboxylase